MLSRHSPRCLRALNDCRPTTYLCPLCVSRNLPAVAPRDAKASRPKAARFGQVRRFVDSKRLQDSTQRVVRRATSPLDDPSLHSVPIPGPGKAQNIREYLNQWSTNYQRELKDNAPDEVSPGDDRRAVKSILPNSLFVRDDGDPVMTDDAGEIDQSFEDMNPYEDEDESIFSDSGTLRPGDIFLMRGEYAMNKLALFLGSNGPQSQYLLQNGQWLVDLQNVFRASLILHDFASEQEMAQIRAVLPTKPIEVKQEGTDASTFRSAMGEVPLNLCASLLRRFSDLSEQAEAFKREQGRALDAMYHNAAHETDFKMVPLNDLVKEHLLLDMDDLSDGAKIALVDVFYNDERYIPRNITNGSSIHIVPKRIYSHSRTVVEWARAYQDAAARASTGKDVSQELKKNPLTGFITKARKLISKSRRIRTPTSECLLGPTREEARPSDGRVERRPSGEEFTVEEKKIVQLLWHTYVRRPFLKTTAVARVQSVCSLIMRATGAYPNYPLERSVAVLFLQELGCLDPWFDWSMHDNEIPIPTFGLNHNLDVIKKRETCAREQLDWNPDSSDPPFPDTMAHLRKDWGDMEAFAIDDAGTTLVDDAISVEPSMDHPDHYWVHIHVAHPSAFIPHNHPFLERAHLMGAALYGIENVTRIMPEDVLQSMSLSVTKPSYVLTCSTLMSSDGKVKDVQVVPGILRTLIRTDSHHLDEDMYTRSTIRHTLTVGTKPHEESSSTHPQMKLSQDDPHRAVDRSLSNAQLDQMRLLHKLLGARFEARKIENPNYLRMPIITGCRLNVRVNRKEEYDHSFERLFRSEFVYGDPILSISHPVADIHSRFGEVNYRTDLVADSMLLGVESLGRWARDREIPLIYRHTATRLGYPVERLNNLAPHEGFVAPRLAESLSPLPAITLNVAQAASWTSPLRKTKDLVNQYTVDAYLKTQAIGARCTHSHALNVTYPFSREELVRFVRNKATVLVLIAKTLSSRTWSLIALFRAFHFNEATLPQTWDVMINNSITLGRRRKKVQGALLAFMLPVEFIPSEQGFENTAAFRQIVPVKLLSINFRKQLIQVMATGPASDEPYTKDLIYPELVQVDEVRQDDA